MPKKKYDFPTYGPNVPTLYNRWKSIRQRCRNPRHQRYPDYGGRGIDMSPLWDDFKRFALDVGLPPLLGGVPNFRDYSLDRIDVHRGYEPGNVRWADLYTQGGNRRASSSQRRRIEYATPWPFGVLADEKDGAKEEQEYAQRWLEGRVKKDEYSW